MKGVRKPKNNKINFQRNYLKIKKPAIAGFSFPLSVNYSERVLAF